MYLKNIIKVCRIHMSTDLLVVGACGVDHTKACSFRVMPGGQVAKLEVQRALCHTMPLEGQTPRNNEN